MSDQETSILIDISDEEFKSFSALVYDLSGINLTEKKQALVRGRLSKVLRKRGINSFKDYLNIVKSDHTGLLITELIDKISTNHTFFFRESEHFIFFLETVLPQILHGLNPTDEIRIWSAGCSSGEEPYTLAILLDDFKRTNNLSFIIKILATDISLTVLNQAIEGVFTEERIKLVPMELKERYFIKAGSENWQVRDEIKKLILFKRLNLMDPAFPFKNQFHSIFCRNVMIYFDKFTKDNLVSRMAGYLKPKHYFFIGHSESLGRDFPGFEYIKPSIYRKKP